MFTTQELLKATEIATGQKPLALRGLDVVRKDTGAAVVSHLEALEIALKHFMGAN